MRLTYLLLLPTLGCSLSLPPSAHPPGVPRDGSRARSIDADLYAQEEALYGGSGSGYFGVSLDGVGDVDDDGYADLAIGQAAGSALGRVFVRGGGVSATSLLATLYSPAGAVGDGFGGAVQFAGDVDGDGFGDLIVGAPEDDTLGADAGAAYVYYGNGSGYDSTASRLDAPDGAAGDGAGSVVAGVGDVNDDGYDDVAVASDRSSVVAATGGRVWVYGGSASGVQLTPIATLSPSDLTAGDRFGKSLAGGGDINADGYADIVVGAPTDDQNDADGGTAYVYLGGPGAVMTEIILTDVAPDPGMAFGGAVSDHTDVDGDGYDDVLVGAHVDGSADPGTVFVYAGTASGPDLTTVSFVQAPDFAAKEYFGYTIHHAGDTNADGYNDVLIGAINTSCLESTPTYTSCGAAYVFAGSAAGLTSPRMIQPSDPRGKYYFGYALAGLGDTDGNGTDDIGVGTFRTDDLGAAYLYRAPCGDADTDGDGLCGSADVCVGDDATGDSDGDGVCDDLDVCYGDDMTGDADGDGVCDDIDNCLGDDMTGDVDGDGVCDDLDRCIGDDASGDADGDGWCDLSVDGSASDCADDAAGAYPGAPEACDGLDTDCDGTIDASEVDADGDGVLPCEGDCDDTSPSVYPGAPEVCDGLDNDCDGAPDPDELDADGDGFTACGGDCDDTSATVGPKAEEICGDGIDGDCDGAVDDGCPITLPYDDQGGGCAVAPVGASLAGAILGLGLALARRRR